MWYLLGLVAGAFIGLVAAITSAGNRPQLRRVDCVIVPGAMVFPSGAPGQMLAARIAHAVRLLDEGWADGIIFTGGQGESGPIESEASRAWAVQLGARPERLFVETKSHTTYENFLYAREVMRERGWVTCLVSSDPFHILRCVLVARQLGLGAWGAPAYESPGYTQLDLRVYYTLREVAGMGRYLLRRGMGRGG